MSDDLVNRLTKTAAIRRRASASEYAPEILHVVARLSLSDAELMDESRDCIHALLAEIAAKDAALTAAMDALNELARHPEDEGHSMPGDFRDFYRDACNFAKQKVEEISTMKGVCNDRK